MKRYVILILTLLKVIFLMADSRDLNLPPAPYYEFSINPIDVGGTIYDYMPGSYCSLPIRVQPAQTDTGLQAGGVYIVFHSRMSSSSKMKVNYAYIDQNGNLIALNPIDYENRWQDYPGFDIDPVTGDPFVAYNVNEDNSKMTNVNFNYDLYDLVGMPGLWLISPFTVINNTIHQEPVVSQNRNQFMYPYVYIGSSPIEGKRRIYITVNNTTKSVGTSYPSKNVLLAFADIDENDILNQNPASWNWRYRTIQQFDDWCNGKPEWARPFKAFAVKDNYVVYVGDLIFNHSGMESTSKLFALVNDNYGEGDFEYYEFDYQNEWPISDVQKIDGTWLYGEIQPATLRWSMFASGHLNAIFTSDNIVSFTGALTIEFYDIEQQGWYYRPDWGHMGVKEFTFNVETGEFGVIDVYPPDLNDIHNNTPVIPWDLDGDGEVDAYDEEGYPEWVPVLPVFHTNLDNSFYYNTIKLTKSDDNSIEIMIWNDCYEAYLQSQGVGGYENWFETSKIMIAIKMYDVWSTPIVIDANEDDINFNDAIRGMIPCYVYPADKIIYENDNTVRLSLFFLNDNSYGSYVLGDGQVPNPDNCRLEYAAIDFNLGWLKNNKKLIARINPFKVSNYPNPFNPQATIRYSLPTSGNVSLEIFNLKGEKVKTLVNRTQRSGEHSIIWDGKDDNGKKQASGIYFCKIKQGKFTTTKKMILMK